MPYCNNNVEVYFLAISSSKSYEKNGMFGNIYATSFIQSKKNPKTTIFYDISFIESIICYSALALAIIEDLMVLI